MKKPVLFPEFRGFFLCQYTIKDLRGSREAEHPVVAERLPVLPVLVALSVPFPFFCSAENHLLIHPVAWGIALC